VIEAGDSEKLNQNLGKTRDVGRDIDVRQMPPMRSDREITEIAIGDKINVRGDIVLLNSEGGSVSEAFKIGKLLREKELKVSVYIPDKCLSSCVFLLMGGVDRQVHVEPDGTNDPKTTIGIHRPYLGEVPEGGADVVKEIYDNIKLSAYKFAEDMGFEKRLIDEMYSVNPNEIRYLRTSELKRFLLIGIDPIYEEQGIIRESEFLGISPVTYRERLNEQERICDPIKSENYIRCMESTKLGLTISEYNRRIGVLFDIKASNVIDFGAMDKKVWIACYRSVMVHNQKHC
jgi:hypothetical protein